MIHGIVCKKPNIYNELGKIVSYNMEFMYGSTTERMKEIYNREINIDEEEDTEVVCNSLNKLYFKLLKRAGVKAELIYKKSSVKRIIDVSDVALVFYDEEGNKYYTNLIGDLENCKAERQTSFFGMSAKNILYTEAKDVKEIPKNEITDLDDSVGIIQQKEYDGDIFFEMLRDEIKDPNHFKKYIGALLGIDTTKYSDDDILISKIDLINKYLINFFDETAGPDERNKYYQNLFKANLLNKFESKKFNAFEFVRRKNGIPIDSKSVIEIKLEDTVVYYVFDIEKGSYIQVPMDDILDVLSGYSEYRNRKLLIEEKTKEDAREL